MEYVCPGGFTTERGNVCSTTATRSPHTRSIMSTPHSNNQYSVPMISLQKVIAARCARRLTRCGAMVLLLVALAGALPGYGRSYYLSGSGSDQAGGTSPRTAWKSLARLAKATLRPGDTVFFRRGDAFPGSVHLRHSGTAAAPIVLTAYGEGAPPVLTGAVPVGGWQGAGPEPLRGAGGRTGVRTVRERPALYPGPLPQRPAFSPSTRDSAKTPSGAPP
jgi:hypothetical protein